MDVPDHPQTLFITDAAVNIFPDLMAKRDIVQNAIDLYAGLGLGVPKVAILSAVETVTVYRYPRPSRPQPFAKWLIAVESPAVFPMVRSHSTTPSAPKRHASRGSNPMWPGRRRFWSFPTSRPATCSRRIALPLQGRCCGIVLGAPGSHRFDLARRQCANPDASCAVAMAFAR